MIWPSQVIHFEALERVNTLAFSVERGPGAKAPGGFAPVGGIYLLTF